MSRPEQGSPLDLAAAYALGALATDEARRFEVYLATSPEAQREVAEYREVASLLALGGESAALGGPLPDLRNRVLARVAAQKTRSVSSAPPVRGEPAVGPGGRLLPLALAASLLAAAGLGAGLISTRGRLSALAAELAARDRAIADVRQQLTEREATLNAILEPGVKLFQLTSSGDPDPLLQLFWDQQRHRAIVHGFRLKAVPSGKVYQLWFITDGKPVPSVTFTPEPSGHAKVEGISVPTDGTISAAAVTVEPAAGSAQPTSPIVLVGTLEKS